MTSENNSDKIIKNTTELDIDGFKKNLEEAKKEPSFDPNEFIAKLLD